MKKTCFGIVLALLVAGALIWALKVPTAKAWTGSVIIRADGTIDPLDAPIITSDNNTYTLTDNISSSANGIVIERSNITIDGNGYTLQGNMAQLSKGISWSSVTNITARNLGIKNFYYGLRALSSSNNNVSENNIANTEYGIVFRNSNDSTLFFNNVIYSGVYGFCLFSSFGNILIGNNATEISASSIYLKDSQNNTLSNNNINATESGIYLEISNKNIVSDNNVMQCRFGIFLEDAYSNTLSGNNIATATTAIVMYSSSYNAVFHNNFTGNRAAYLSENSVENVWDNGSSGNYWSNYNGIDANHDSIGDTPYIINAYNKDNYPLIPEFPSFLILSLFFIATLLAVMTYVRAKQARKSVKGE